MKIGSRSSSNHYRVYQKNNNVEFELEIKNKGVKSFQNFLFTNQIEKFEHKLAAHFYKISINWLDLKTFCIDWLVNRVRKIAENQELNFFLVTDYLGFTV